MKVAIITPYYKESNETLERCIKSVQNQTYKNIIHILIADGNPTDLNLPSEIKHIIIPNSNDVGTTPRNVGALIAMAQEAKAIAFLDADCWIEPNYIEEMTKQMISSDSLIVTSPRVLYQIDGSIMGLDTESDGDAFNDTNCMLIRHDGYNLLDSWIFAPRDKSPFHDRIFWKTILDKNIKKTRINSSNVNYTTIYADHYLYYGLPVPSEAKIVVKSENGWQFKLYNQIKCSIHSLVWPNSDVRLIQNHKKVCDYFNINVEYHQEKIDHGEWMNNVILQSDSEIVGFMDVDCVPFCRSIVDHAISWVAQHKSFLGIAQVSNHIPPYSHIYAGPAFYFMWRETWEKLNRPTFCATPQADVAENVSYMAEISRVFYKTLYPTHYTKAPRDGLWRLHTYGDFGIGTVYEGGVYHLYEGRFAEQIDLFSEVCEQIVQEKFTTQGMNPCR